jgi:hypothetical protein
VDDHQVLFCLHMASAGKAFVVQDEDAFNEELARAGLSPTEYVITHTTSPTAATARAINDALDALVNRPRDRRLRPGRERLHH